MLGVTHGIRDDGTYGTRFSRVALAEYVATIATVGAAALPISVRRMALAGARTGPRITASWSGLNHYNKGGLMTPMEHIIYHHGPNTGWDDVSKFAPGTGAREIKSYVDEALALGNPVPNGVNGYEILYDFGSKSIGFDKAGNSTSRLMVYVRDGKIQTAFPYPY